jgi:hypothetical protein
MKNKKYHTVRAILKLRRQIVESGKIDIHDTQIYNRSLSWLGIGASIKRMGIN